MPPTLILIRHAQALHNIPKPGQYAIHDPDLSEDGFAQLAALRQSLMANPVAQNAGLLVTSPMRRTIQTALGCLDWLMDKGVKLEADADWQENSAKPCDTGTPAPALAAEFPAVDFAALDPVYPDKTSAAGARYAHTRPAILQRAQAALARLHARPERVVVVVSHSGFLRAGVSGAWFYNADYRVFEFEDRPEGAGPGVPYRLRQCPETEARGGGLGLSFKHCVELGEGLPEDGQTPDETV